MPQVKVSALPSKTTITNTDLFLLSEDAGGGLFTSKKMTKQDLVIALGFPPSWGLTGNSGTNPATNFIGTTDNNALVFKTNNIERIRVNSTNGFVGIGTVPSGNFHVKGSYTLFQTSSALSGITPNDNVVIDSGSFDNKIGLYSGDAAKVSISHRRAGKVGGAQIQLGLNDTAIDHDGFYVKTGSSGDTSNNYDLAIRDNGRFYLGGYSTLFTSHAKFNMISEGNTASTIALQIKDSLSTYLLRIWDHQRIAINRPNAYSPSATLDIYGVANDTIIVDTISGRTLDLNIGGDMVIGRTIASGGSLGIKGNGSAFTGSPLAAFHLKGTIRVDDQRTATAGAASGQYLTINCDGTSYKIALLNP